MNASLTPARTEEPASTSSIPINALVPEEHKGCTVKLMSTTAILSSILSPMSRSASTMASVLTGLGVTIAIAYLASLASAVKEMSTNACPTPATPEELRTAFSWLMITGASVDRDIQDDAATQWSMDARASHVEMVEHVLSRVTQIADSSVNAHLALMVLSANTIHGPVAISPACMADPASPSSKPRSACAPRPTPVPSASTPSAAPATQALVTTGARANLFLNPRFISVCARENSMASTAIFWIMSSVGALGRTSFRPRLKSSVRSQCAHPPPGTRFATPSATTMHAAGTVATVP